MFLLAGFMCPGNAAVRDKADAAIDMPDALGNLGSRIQQSDASQPGKPLDQEITKPIHSIFNDRAVLIAYIESSNTIALSAVVFKSFNTYS